ncbi:Gfo/Idh/MocA family oxidoreductase [bacterium]|jgi:myo-inositol 2-dehydrogenase / D-chiro-inositol 1-dehydrogenase|nr:Gfo/Idh/MocA family oxidoreductase [bacterium]MDB4745589.1 Gfo/Idh/MocA family oxidoreductase [Verrucomicrobiota bacterium]
MNDKTNSQRNEDSVSRRKFLKSTSTAVVGGSLLSSLAIKPGVFADHHDEVKVALVGCGGRGSGAADQALNTYDQGPIKLVAMADAFRDRLDGSFNNLHKKHGDRVAVPEGQKFIGFDAYKQAIELADVVILATPPGFRPIHFEEAVKQGKNVFMEKPVATDPAGVRKVLAAAKEAKKKNLKVGVGLQRHHQAGYIETIKRLQDGAIGDIIATRAYWNGNTPWVRKRADLEKAAGRKLTEMEYQMRNWYYFNWICGDHITEQHIHNLDVINWLKDGFPVKANGMGGAEVRVGKDFGEIFDHHAVEFEYADGSRMFSQCRHQVGCWNSVSEHAHGSKGNARLDRYTITGDNSWRFRGKGKNPYQQEHDDLFHAIRNNEDYNEAEYGAKSSMTSILGRMATYSGKEVEWDKAIASEISIMPDSFEWDAPTKSVPGPDGLYPHPIPGQSILV